MPANGQAGKTKQRLRRTVSHITRPASGRNTLGTVALRIEPSKSIRNSTRLSLPRKRARSTTARAGTPSLGSAAALAAAVEVDAQMLRAEHDLHRGAVRYAGRQKLAKGSARQGAVHLALSTFTSLKKETAALVNGVGIDVVGRALLHDPAAAHQRRSRRPMRIASSGSCVTSRTAVSSSFKRLSGLVADAVAQPVVEAGERLIHQHDARPRRNRAGQCHPLLLTARQLMRVAVDEALERTPGSRVPRPGRVSRPCCPSGQSRRLSATLRCGNRAKSWNISPISRRSGGTRNTVSQISLPST